MAQTIFVGSVEKEGAVVTENTPAHFIQCCHLENVTVTDQEITHNPSGIRAIVHQCPVGVLICSRNSK